MSQVNASGNDGFSGRPDQVILEELETTRQLLQSQQNLIESLIEKLESSQAQIDQLESDLSLAQQNHTDQSYLLQETETACLDLRTRLFRQQRQTFQFKVALEKCLESALQPPPGQDNASGSSAVGELRSPLPRTSVSTADSSSDNLDPGYFNLSRGSSLKNSLVGQLEASPRSEMLSVSTPEKPFHLPLVFREQPVQPWSIANGATHTTTVPHQPIVESTSTPQPALVQSNYSTSSTPRVSPLSPCRSKRKSLADVQLPCLPRRA